MQDRTPLLDMQTFEALLEVHKVIAGADNGDGLIERNDLAYIHAKIEDILKFNSLPPVDPRSDPSVIDKIKRLGRKLLP